MKTLTIILAVALGGCCAEAEGAYVAIADPLTYAQAEDACDDLGGSLASADASEYADAYRACVGASDGRDRCWTSTPSYAPGLVYVIEEAAPCPEGNCGITAPLEATDTEDTANTAGVVCKL